MKITNCIICEDIRQELGNKHSLMGIYDDSIIFRTPPDQLNNWPKSKQLSFFIRISLDKEEDLSAFNHMTIESNLNGDIEEILKIKINYAPNIKKMNIAASIGNFIFKNKGILSFNLRFYDKNNEIISVLENFYHLKIDEIDKI